MIQVRRDIRISIVLVNWNTRELLLDCIQSIYDNTEESRKEIIVVDNASTDGSVAAVRQRYPGVKLICNESNLGFSRANNIGIHESTGQYVCLINSDIKLIKGCLDILVKYLDNNKSVGLIGPKILNEDRTLQISCREYPTIWNNLCAALALNLIFPRAGIFSGEMMTYFRHDKKKQVEVLVGCFLLTRKEVINGLGGLDERYFIYAEDMDWCKRINEEGWKVIFNPDAHAIHYEGRSSLAFPIRFNLEQEKAILQYWQKHEGKYKTRCYIAIKAIHHLLRLISFSAGYAFFNNDVIKQKIERSRMNLLWLGKQMRDRK